MHKRFWVQVDPFDRDLVAAAIEAGAEAVVVPDGRSGEAHALGRIHTIAADGDWQWGRDVARVRIEGEADEEAVDGRLPTLIDNAAWTIIPLENLISRVGGNLIQSVATAEQAGIALQVMERGADGVLLRSDDAAEIRRTGEVVSRAAAEPLSLSTARVTAVRPVAMSDRCCIDTTSLLPPGEGLLVGNSGSALFLVHNENLATPYCAARPFRVNAGAVHAYVRLPGDRTSYLCELAAGDSILAVGPDGANRPVAVGRNKIERRPMLLVEAQAEDGRTVCLVLQNAETVRLTRPGGDPASVATLRTGDKVLAWFGGPGGRHFGRPVEETIQEQ